MSVECANCGAVPIYRNDRCSACWWYRRRHGGEERPSDLVIRHGRRELDKRLERQAWGDILPW